MSTTTSKPAAALIVPHDAMSIRESVTLKPGVYVLPNGLTIDADDVTLDGNGAMLVGLDRCGVGVSVTGRSGVTIRNLRIREFYHGIAVRNAERIRIEKNHITSTAEVPANTIFLDIWLDAEHAYGGGILLDHVEDADILDNDLQHQGCGLLSYHCKRLNVQRNNASFCSAFGLHLFGVCDSRYERNWADYCCRYEPRDKDPSIVTANAALGHMGADATGFLIVYSSCRNTFRSNFARMGGDGFFLAGQSSKHEPCPCNENLFEYNDGSLSPNIAFEATFSRGNIFRYNRADRCNFGFWHGFSSDFVLEHNSVVLNRQAGIAVENGARFRVRHNQFQRNGTGILLWSKYDAATFERMPDNRTVHHWMIEENTFTRNGTGIAILADKDHGIRPMPAETCGRPEIRPHDNAIVRNDIQDNRIGIELFRADRTIIERNILNRNVEANIRQDDVGETIIRNNLGAVGAYL